MYDRKWLIEKAKTATKPSEQMIIRHHWYTSQGMDDHEINKYFPKESVKKPKK